MTSKEARNMQNDIIEKAGINPKTLLSSVLYCQKLERNISTVLFLPYFALIIVATLTQKTNASTQVPNWEGRLIYLGIGCVLLGFIYSLWVTYVVPRIYAWRVQVFADKNLLYLLPQSTLVELIPDTVRHDDIHHVQAVGCALTVADQQVTVFDYSCIVGSGKHREYLAKGLAVMQLKGSYPHLFLDSKKNGKNHQYAASQRVKLEGDFSKYFDVYMPEGSQAGSLTVFAPDIMQTILDTGKLFDVEIEGSQAVIISDEPVFTRKVLPSILNCANGLSKEFKQLDRTWQPVFDASSRPFTLKGQPLWRVFLIALVPFIVALSSHALPENIRHPIKNQPAPIVSHEPEGPYARDAATLANAYQIANKLNAYTAKYPVPDSLTEAHITNTLLTITYAKLMPQTYQFCTTYYNYVNGNGPTRTSGNIVAYYGSTVDSPNLPPTLQIVEWHEQGKNCQVIKPELPATE